LDQRGLHGDDQNGLYSDDQCGLNGGDNFVHGSGLLV
jgi:hypothetical protein